MRASVTAAAFISLLVLAGAPRAQTPIYDLLIKNGRVVDGTGSPWYRADVAVRGDTIARIAPRIDAPATRTIDAAGKVVSPGFIDLHTHARRGIFQVPGADNYVRQGVTTIMEGPDGSSPLPIRPFLDRVAALKVTPNFGLFVGQGTVRDEVIGPINRKATDAELEQMRGLVRQGMEDGAFGLSSGLFYVPGTFTPTAEVVELAKVAGRMGGIYISHMRDEANGVLDSVRETIEIGEQGGLPTQITHHKVIGKKNWGRAVDTLKLVDEARARGVDATIDQYPYTASATSIQAALMPAYALEGGREALLERLQTPGIRNELRKETARLIAEERGGGDPNNVQLSRCDWDHSLDGKRLGDVTKGRGLEPTIDNAAETVLWIVEKGGCGGIFHAIDEDDLQAVLRHPATMIASDGEVPVFGQASPHPRSYGTFVRVLGRYARDLKTITLEEAVRKMSAFPAQRIGLADRGVLREGMKADIAVFDPATVRDMATFERPHQYAEGVTQVIVNGQVVFDAGRMTDARPGRILYGPGTALNARRAEAASMIQASHVMKEHFLRDAFGWGFVLWLIGYALGIALFAFVPRSLIGWMITPFAIALTLWVAFKKVKGSTLRYFGLVALVWLLIALVGDYFFIVKAFAPADGYYKADVYLYYALTLAIPLFAGWRRNSGRAPPDPSRHIV